MTHCTEQDRIHAQRAIPIPGEAAVLGAILLNPDAMSKTYAIIGDKAEAFLDARHAAIWEVMVSRHLDGCHVDVVTLLDALPDALEDGMASYIGELTGAVPTSAHAEQYAIDVMTAYREREATMHALAIVSTNDRAEIGRRLSALRGLASPVAMRAPQAISKVGESLLVELEAIKDSPRRAGIPTGLSALDAILRGGLHNAEVTIVAGRPGQGKTALALNIAHHAAILQIPTLMFSLEMNAASLAERVWNIHDGVTTQRIRAGFAIQWDIDRVKTVCAESGKWSLWVDDAATMTMPYIEAQAKRFAEHRQSSLIMVDYMQLIKPSGRGHSREREVAEISAAMKGLSRELDCPVLCLSQLSREAEQITSRFGKLRSLRESGAVEQDADNVLILSPESDKPNCVNTFITIAKQRSGPTGEVLAHFNRERQTFSEVDKHAGERTSTPYEDDDDERPF